MQIFPLLRTTALLAVASATLSVEAAKPAKSTAPAPAAKADRKADSATAPKPGARPARARRWDYPTEKNKPVWQPQLARVEIPPLPAGVEELKFNEFFKLPVGPLGLELTVRLKSLDGKKVRILGFQIREQLSDCSDCASAAKQPGARPRPAWMNHIVPGRLLLSPSPININMAHYGLADDLPPQIAYIDVPEYFGERVPFTPGLLLLTGKISVGNKTEADGRISIVRLELDEPPDEAVVKAGPSSEPGAMPAPAIRNPQSEIPNGTLQPENTKVSTN